MIPSVQTLKNNLVYRPDVLSQHQTLFPSLKSATMANGVTYAAIPHTLDHAVVLNNLGYKAPSPIRLTYEWPGKFKPYAHQRETSEFLTLNKRAFCLNGMGTGKTMAVLWAADYLMKIGKVRRALILSPLSTLQQVWAREIFANLPSRQYAVLHGSRQKRLDMLKTKADFYIINHDGVEVISEELLKRDDIDMIIIDEVAVLRNAQTKRWKTVKAMVNRDVWCWGLTGTPTPNCPTDAYAQMKLIRPENYSGHFTKFKMLTMMQLGQFKWIPRRGTEEIIANVLKPALRYALEDCIELPPTIYHDREAELSAEQKVHYKALERQAVTEIRGKQITAVNSAVLISKLTQVACIAGGTPVLTSRGWVPIELVRRKDEVWDGLQWCEHDGVVDNGVQPVVDCGEVNMTKDHLILTTQGWKTAEDANYGYASERFKWATVRIPDGFGTRRLDGQTQFEMRDMALSMRLRSRGGAYQSELNKRQQAEWQPLRVQGRGVQQDTRHDEHTPIQNMVTDAGEMPHGNAQGLPELWRTWCAGMRTVVQLVRGLLGRCKARLSGRLNARENRQRRELRAIQLSVGISANAGKQSPKQCIYRDTEGQNDCSASCESFWVEDSDTRSTNKQVQVGCATRSDYARVYDIVNCGPRNRFTVMGTEGTARIVHNCGVTYAGEEGKAEIDFGPRLSVLKEAIEESESKVIVFVPFTGVLDALNRELSKDWSCAVVDGGTSSSKRNQIFDAFRSTPNPRVLIANPQTMSHGLTLTEASTIVWYAPIYSAEYFQQANARIVRPGQTMKTNIVHISATSVERRIYAVLREKGALQDVILELAKDGK